MSATSKTTTVKLNDADIRELATKRKALENARTELRDFTQGLKSRVNKMALPVLGMRISSSSTSFSDDGYATLIWYPISDDPLKEYESDKEE